MKKKDFTKGSKDKGTVILGMSGGIDSSVALFLLKKQGFRVIGLSLKFGFWENTKNELKENICCSNKSIERARRICQKYDVPHFTIDYSQEFQKKVINYFIKDLRHNRTPNPCLFCNRDVKISALLAFAKEKKAQYIATGHYAKIKKTSKGYQLLKAKDKRKDQSYFLSLLSQAQVSKLILPLGDYLKKDVYAIAKKEGIEVAPKESQDLCFVGDKSMPDFLKEEVGLKPGKILDTQGNVLGEHQGLHFYTRGQRKGIKLPNGPFWVIDFDKKNNSLIVTNDSESLKLFNREVVLSNVNFVSGNAPKKALEVEAKVRYRQPLAKAILKSGNISRLSRDSLSRGLTSGNGSENATKAKLTFGSPTSESWRLVFDEPQKAVTPGQIAVFYRGEICLGGGIIQ